MRPPPPLHRTLGLPGAGRSIPRPDQTGRAAARPEMVQISLVRMALMSDLSDTGVVSTLSTSGYRALRLAALQPFREASDPEKPHPASGIAHEFVDHEIWGEAHQQTGGSTRGASGQNRHSVERGRHSRSCKADPETHRHRRICSDDRIPGVRLWFIRGASSSESTLRHCVEPPGGKWTSGKRWRATSKSAPTSSCSIRTDHRLCHLRRADTDIRRGGQSPDRRRVGRARSELVPRCAPGR